MHGSIVDFNFTEKMATTGTASIHAASEEENNITAGFCRSLIDGEDRTYISS